MTGVRIYKKRPADWPDPDQIAGRYPTVFGTLVITDKGISTLERDQ